MCVISAIKESSILRLYMDLYVNAIMLWFHNENLPLLTASIKRRMNERSEGKKRDPGN